MKKALSYFFRLTILLCLIVGLAAFFAWSRAPDFVAKKLSDQLKVAVEIGDISLSFSQIEIDHLEIANLPNSHLKKALSIGTITCKNELLNYLDKKISINEISLDNVYIGLEFDSPKGTQGNWTTLMNNLQSSQKKVSEKDSKTVEIKQLILTNIQVEVVYKSAGGAIKKLPMIKQIVLTNITSSEGIPSEQIMQSVLGQMLKSVFVEENLKSMFEGILDEPQNAFDTLMKPFKGLF